jgi:hypothetical protein
MLDRSNVRPQPLVALSFQGSGPFGQLLASFTVESRLLWLALVALLVPCKTVNIRYKGAGGLGLRPLPNVECSGSVGAHVHCEAGHDS